ncbi:hypothetical protein [Bradyrhizobium barranii]
MKKLNESFAASQVAVGTTATLIVAAAAGRDHVSIQPIGVVTVYVGGPGVTSLTGYPVPVGYALDMETTADIYAVAASATAVAVLAEG